jgi:putative membrane protein
VINAFMVLLASKWVEGFRVDGFWWALLFSFLLAILNSWLQNLLLKDYKQDYNR